MKHILETLYHYGTLTKNDAQYALQQLALGACNESQAAAFLSAYIMRRPSVAELEGFRDAMMALCIPLDFAGYEAIDIVGTGGDGKNTFNISTLSAIVTAAAGVPVIKHGNYAASSVSGSSNVLEHLGYVFSERQERLATQLEQANICFVHAPLFHPAMKQVAMVRKNMGVRTFFNLLGPLINPAQPKNQLLGVNSLETGRMYHYLLQETGRRYTIVHSLDGYDELSLTGAFKLISTAQERLCLPADLGLEQVAPEALQSGDSIAAAANIFIAVLQGKGTKAQRAVVVANAALALHCARPDQSFADCLGLAVEALDSLKAYQTFQTLLKQPI
ncbi:anthranilate phosphoribosyltransferase [Taibaiella sp. KBW10]|uniref:anthranilate phosphoribosyltransferase n=1 Tax=Taibaiella sp. KBW10 TaxID=2153357 RepID=UPI000F5B7671|nr:anthranilate phosphoribosyltransferase [Taibaiella sp. KBW10]RQO29819.1 anthranilate phosphoribosyltransferase [Taibaiella sp. KBW10]